MLLRLIARSERRNRRLRRRNERWQWRRRYWDVLKSERWKHLRADAIAETGGRCEACGYFGRQRLRLRHKHFRTLGQETRDDVELLCPWCHNSERREWRQRYWAVLKSERWKQLRAEVITETGGRCETCNYLGRNRLHLHHKHYRTLGEETRSDVELLCNSCHKKADAGRVRFIFERRIIKRLLPSFSGKLRLQIRRQRD
jgi:predicted HNH restriction endonuclease